MKIGYIYGVLIGLMLFTLACNTKSNTRNRETPTDIAHIYELKRIALLSQFNEIDSFDRATGLARTQKGETYGYIDTTGKEIVPCINYNVQDFTEGLGLVQEHEDRGLYFVDKTGKKVIDLAGYSNAFSFKGGYATVEKNDKFGLIDKTGKEVIACSAKEGIFMLSPGNFIFYDGKAKSIVDANGKPSLPFTGFSEIYYNPIANQYAINTGGKWLIANPDGSTLITPDAEGLIYRDGLYFVSKFVEGAGTQFGVMNAAGKMIIPYGKYESRNTNASDGMICVGKETGKSATDVEGVQQVHLKVGYCDTTGKEVIPLQFDDAMMDFSEGLAPVQQNEKMGYIDKSGKWVIPAVYEKAENFRNGIARVSGTLSDEYIDKTGKVIK